MYSFVLTPFAPFVPCIYRRVEHTSEAELEVEAESAADVLAEATSAFGDLLTDAPRLEELEVEVRASAHDFPTLFAEWLGELAYLAETDGFIPERAVRMDLAAPRLRPCSPVTAPSTRASSRG